MVGAPAGLDGRFEVRPAAEVLQETGWARSVGGVGPYLTLFASAGMGREAVDRAVAQLDTYHLPSERGCTYVLPAADFALGLKLGVVSSDAEVKSAQKVGVTEAEIDTLCAAIVKALEKGPLDTDELRQAVGGAVRSLGPEGVKRGVTTTLAVGLGRLQARGEIRRVPANGRLDQQRYRYTLWHPGPLRGFSLSVEEAQFELARRFFLWIGPATLAEFQWFSGLGVKAAKAAVEPLQLESIRDKLLPADLRAGFDSFQVPREPRYVLVSSLDGISQLRRDVKGLLAPEDWKRKVCVEKDYKPAGELTDLPSHAILDRGRIVGLWEYDAEAQAIAWMSFVPVNNELKKAVARTEEYVRNDLGDARSFSLDSPKSRAPRVQALRKAAAE
jgi:hypothetical protein